MKENHHEHPLNHFGQLLFLVLFIIIWISDSFIFHKLTLLSSYVPFWTRIVLFIIDILLVVYLFKAVIFAFSNENSSSQIITNGPFKYIRHPMYLACILFYCGLWFLTLSLYSLFVLIGIFVFYNSLGKYEEIFLLDKYGKPYLDYIKSTGRWIPKVKTDNL